MKTKEGDNDRFGTFIEGLVYTLALIALMLLVCYFIDSRWFDKSLTFILIGILAIAFYLNGFKRVAEKKLGYLRKWGARDFTEIYGEGIWWVFPFWSFKEDDHFDIYKEGKSVEFSCITMDEIKLNVHIDYYWSVTDPKRRDNSDVPSLINQTFKYQLGIYIRTRNAIELLADSEISAKALKHFLGEVGQKIGISIDQVLPIVNYEESVGKYITDIRLKYRELQYQIDSLVLKRADMKIDEQQIMDCIRNLGFNNKEAMDFIKVYKNRVSFEEKYFKVEGLENILASVIRLLGRQL